MAFPLLIYGSIAAIGVIAFLFSVKSRKSYTCPSCGEKIRVEHMDAQRCNVCGTSLEKVEK